MADYAQSARLKKTVKSKTRVPPWVWLLTGTITGVFIACLAYLSGIAPAGHGVQATVANPPAQGPIVVPQERNKPTFEFYTRLPDKEVNLAPPPDQGTATAAQPAPAKEGLAYVLQTGAFRQSTDADTLRAKLILLGLEAQIQTVDNHGQVWYRVTTGPFMSMEKADEARKLLQDNGVANPLLLKQPVSAIPPAASHP